MAKDLKNRKVAILATDGFEQVELTEPKQALQAGAQVHCEGKHPAQARSV